MHLPIKKICTLGILPIAIALWNCTTDGEAVTVGDDELSGVQIIDDSIFDEPGEEDDEEIDEEGEEGEPEAVESSSSRAKSSSSKAKSSSSKVKSSSSSEKSSSSKAKSSSSSAKSSSSKAKSSSSKAKSSSSKAKSSSKSKTESTEIDEVDTDAGLSEIDSATVGFMDKLDSAEQAKIKKLVKAKDSSIQKNDAPSLDFGSLDFDENEYLCKAQDGTWYRITESTVDSIMVELFGMTLKQIKVTKYSYDFEACEEIYLRSKE